MNLTKLLQNHNLISEEDRAAIDADRAKNHSLDEAFGTRNISLADKLNELAEQYGMSGRILGEERIPNEVLGYIPVDSARHYGFVPLAVNNGALEVGITDPDNIEATDALQFISNRIGMPYKLVLITEDDFKRVVDSYQNLTGEIGKALSEIDSEDAEEKKGESKEKQAQESAVMAASQDGPVDLTGTSGSGSIHEDAPVTKIVSSILRYAIEGHASDIHIEPAVGKTRVRFRVDGELHTSLELPGRIHDAVVARVKILAKLRLDERRKPQDGRFSATVDKHRIDFRVSTFPTEFGEKVVMRILDQSNATATLDSIGLSPEQLKAISEMMKAPFGIILIAGPTGSGKSTTLFSMLSTRNRETENVVSLEDPVEYQIPGVSQSQVRPEIGYTFASGLRSILRQDPDVIMVGEIRDKETAALAVQAALTGHLVFSTIHTNTAAGAIPRLVDMGIDPFLIAPTMIGVIGQRLVRKLCRGAGVPFEISDSLRAYLQREFSDLPEQYHGKLPPFERFYHAQPTDECPDGTHGRLGVFEILRMSKKLEQVILKEPVEERVFEAVREDGMFTMREDAIIKALEGQIPFEEVNTLGGELFPDADQDVDAT